jgi:tRNA threonylcarbamoyladenosine biosynthesis protein TsaB
MPTNVHLAIETSGRSSSVALCVEGRPVVEKSIGQRRHALDLMPAIDALFQQAQAKPGALKSISVSTGPGSFTGLRIGITTAKLMARTTGAQVFAVPTIDSLFLGLIDADQALLPPTVAVMLNLKADTGWSCLFGREHGQWQPMIPHGLHTLEQLRDLTVGELGLICEVLPESLASLPEPDAALQAMNTRQLPASLAVSHARNVLRIGLGLASNLPAPTPVDPLDITPIYAREPEAVTLWNKHHGV